jgi:hypothetical protein
MPDGSLYNRFGKRGHLLAAPYRGLAPIGMEPDEALLCAYVEEKRVLIHRSSSEAEFSAGRVETA